MKPVKFLNGWGTNNHEWSQNLLFRPTSSYKDTWHDYQYLRRPARLRISKDRAVLEFIQNDLYYPTFMDKIAHLFYSINKSHAFIDGNKRTCIALSALFLQINGYDYCVKDFIYRMENIVVWVADNKIEKDLLKDIIEDIIMQEEREFVQLALINALKTEVDA